MLREALLRSTEVANVLFGAAVQPGGEAAPVAAHPRRVFGPPEHPFGELSCAVFGILSGQAAAPGDGACEFEQHPAEVIPRAGTCAHGCLCGNLFLCCFHFSIPRRMYGPCWTARLWSARLKHGPHLRPALYGPVD